jgi:hypothetical protein
MVALGLTWYWNTLAKASKQSDEVSTTYNCKEDQVWSPVLESCTLKPMMQLSMMDELVSYNKRTSAASRVEAGSF